MSGLTSPRDGDSGAAPAPVAPRRALVPPFFELGPKNLLRLPEVLHLAWVGAEAGRDAGVTVVLTVPAAYVAPVAALGTDVLVFSQELSADTIGASFGSVTAEALVDVGADGVMLDHDAAPKDPSDLRETTARAAEAGLLTILCAGTTEGAVRAAALHPTAVLHEPPALIGGAADGARPWIPEVDAAVASRQPDVLVMHAGGVRSPATVRAVMAAGAAGTGSTSGVLSAEDPAAALRAFVTATRTGWDDAHPEHRASGPDARPTDAHRPVTDHH